MSIEASILYSYNCIYNMTVTLLTFLLFHFFFSVSFAEEDWQNEKGRNQQNEQGNYTIQANIPFFFLLFILIFLFSMCSVVAQCAAGAIVRDTRSLRFNHRCIKNNYFVCIMCRNRIPLWCWRAMVLNASLATVSLFRSFSYSLHGSSQLQHLFR